MELLERIEAYLERTWVLPSTFGRRAFGDPRLVREADCQGRRRSIASARISESTALGRSAALPYSNRSRKLCYWALCSSDNQGAVLSLHGVQFRSHGKDKSQTENSIPKPESMHASLG